MELSPLDQFRVKPIIHLECFGYDLSFTNSSLFMIIAVLVTSLTLWLITKKPTMVPNRLQAFGELVHDFVLDALNQNTMGEGAPYFPFVFTLFCFIVALNLLGLIPYTFAVTGQLAVTLTLAMIVFITLNIIAFYKHGFKFFRIFLPEGLPIALAPIMIVIEFFVYMIRPVTLSVRLAANIAAGHIILYIASAFIVLSGLFMGVVPAPLAVLFNGFEIFVALLQAYIFTILTCVYLNDAIHLH